MPSLVSISLLFITAIAFIVAIIWRINHGREHSLILGICSVALATAAYYSYDQYATLPLLAGTPIDRLAISAFWWLGFAYLINALIKRFLYLRNLTFEGEPTVPLLIQHLVTLLVFLIAGMIIIRFVYQQSITVLATASGALALVLGYSARNLLDEVFAGLALNINAPFKKGDLVKIEDDWGYIKDINWRSVTFLDMDLNFVTLANTRLVASKIRNLEHPTKLTRRIMEFRVEYNAPPAVVISQLAAAMTECPHIADHPWNYVAFLEADEKGMMYRIAFHIKDYNYWFIASDELINSIWYRFARLEIRWAHQRNLNFKTTEDEQRGLQNTAYNLKKWKELIEHIENVPIFEGITQGDVEFLAKTAIPHVIGPPERIIKAGSQYYSMFFIISGTADVYEIENDSEVFLKQIGAYEPIGIKSYTTGAPQRTTIRATDECVILEFKHESLHQVFEHSPEAIKVMGKNLAEWEQADLDLSAQNKLNRKQEAIILKTRSAWLTKNITRFFNRKQKEIEVEADQNPEYTDY